jgi:hypothetical protein
MQCWIRKLLIKILETNLKYKPLINKHQLLTSKMKENFDIVKTSDRIKVVKKIIKINM